MGTGEGPPQHPEHDPPNHHLRFDNITVPTPIDIPYTTIEVVIGVAAVVGNSLVILVFVKFHILKTVTNYYVISLAVADLLVGLVGIPCAIATSVGLPPNFQACLFMNSLLLLLCTSSIFSLVAVTVDRYWAIIHPLSYPAMMTSRRALVVIGLSWFLASIVGLLPSMGWNKGPPTGPRCFFMEVIDLRYLVFIYFATILTPSAFMAVVYARIYCAIKSQLRRMTCQMLPKDSKGRSASSLKSAGRAAQGVAVIVLLFVVSWLPLYTINTIMCFCPSCSIPQHLLKAMILLSHLNSAWNPILYAWGMKDFKVALRRLLVCGGKNEYMLHPNRSYVSNGLRTGTAVEPASTEL